MRAPMAVARVDVLSDVLRTMPLSGAMLFLVEASAPWRSHAPETRGVRAASCCRHAQHLVSYHIVVQGQLLGRARRRAAAAAVEAGDVLIVPHGDA